MILRQSSAVEIVAVVGLVVTCILWQCGKLVPSRLYLWGPFAVWSEVLLFRGMWNFRARLSGRSDDVIINPVINHKDAATETDTEQTPLTPPSPPTTSEQKPISDRHLQVVIPNVDEIVEDIKFDPINDEPVADKPASSKRPRPPPPPREDVEDGFSDRQYGLHHCSLLRGDDIVLFEQVAKAKEWLIVVSNKSCTESRWNWYGTVYDHNRK